MKKYIVLYLSQCIEYQFVRVMHYWAVKVNPSLLLFGTTANLSSVNLIPRGWIFETTP